MNTQRHDTRRRRPKGFTLIELLVVITIIVILGAVVGPKLIGQTERGKEGAVIAQVKSLQTAADSYHLAHGRPISSLQDLVPEFFDEGDLPAADPWGDSYSVEKRGDGTVKISSPNYQRVKEESKNVSKADVTIGG